MSEERLQKEVDNLKAEISLLTGAADELKSDNKRLLRDVEALKAEALKIGTQLRSAESAKAKAEADLEHVGAELKETKAEARDRRHEAKALNEQLSTLTAERDDWKTRAETDPEGHNARIAELTTKLRGVTHKQAFAEAAKGLKVSDPVRVADLWALSGYAPDSDDADPAKLTDAIQGALKGRPWLLDSEPAPATQATSTTAPGGATTAPGGANGATTHAQAIAQAANGKPGPGADRGQSLQTQATQPSTRIPGSFGHHM